MEVVHFADIPSVATSHDVDLRKFVLAAAGKYPEGQVKSFTQIKFDNSQPRTFQTAKNEMIIIVQSDGESRIQGNYAETLKTHDMLSVSPSQSFVLETDSTSYLHCLIWLISS